MLPLSSANWAHFCISGNRPRAVANLRQREGHWQPTSVTALGGSVASIQLRQGPRTARESARCPGPAQRSAARQRGAQLQLQLGCSQPSALRAAWNQRRAAVAGWGRMQARRIGLAIGRASPPERPLPGCSLPIHRLRAACGSCMLRYQARQLRWRKRRVAAASSGLVCARPTLLGASFACDFDPSVPDATQVRRRDAACRKRCQMREFNADICAKPTALAADRRLNSKARSGLRSSKGARVVFSARMLP